MALEYPPSHVEPMFQALFEALTYVGGQLGSRERTPAAAFAPIGIDALNELESALPELQTAWGKADALQEGGRGLGLLAQEMDTYCLQTAPWTGYGSIDNRDQVFKDQYPQEKPEPPAIAFLKRMARIAATLVGSVLQVIGEHLSAKWKAILDVLKEIFEILGDK